MTAQAGRDVLLKIGDGGLPESFDTVAGVRAKTISLNAKVIDATSADSPGAWRELAAGAGVRSASVTGSGVFRDEDADETVRAAFMAQDARSWRLVIPDFGVFEGPFLVASLEYSGRYDSEAQFSLTLASAGALTFAAA